MNEERPALLPRKLWETAANNWQVRCMQNDVTPPFDWALEFNYDGNVQLVVLHDGFKYTHRFEFDTETMAGLLKGELDWTAEMMAHRDKCEHNAEDASELYAALGYFHV